MGTAFVSWGRGSADGAEPDPEHLPVGCEVSACPSVGFLTFYKEHNQARCSEALAMEPSCVNTARGNHSATCVATSSGGAWLAFALPSSRPLQPVPVQRIEHQTLAASKDQQRSKPLLSATVAAGAAGCF